MGPLLLEQLRSQTQAAHLALEAQPLLKRLLSNGLNRTEYGHVLQAMLAFYQSLEPALVPATTALLLRHPDPEYRYLPRAPLLANDCRVLDIAISGFKAAPLQLRLNDGGAHLLGVLYVIEGATQGGRLIAQHVARALGVSQRSGASFFNLHRWDHSWTAFRSWVNRDLADQYQDEITRVIEGADMTFSALGTHLDQWQRLTHGS